MPKVSRGGEDAQKQAWAGTSKDSLGLCVSSSLCLDTMAGAAGLCRLPALQSSMWKEAEAAGRLWMRTYLPPSEQWPALRKEAAFMVRPGSQLLPATWTQCRCWEAGPPLGSSEASHLLCSKHPGLIPSA